MDLCFFCDRPKNEVKTLTESSRKSGTFICNYCVGSLVQTAPTLGKKGREDLPLLKPKQIKAYLDDYVIAQEDPKKDISVAIYNHYKRRNALRQGLQFDVDIQKSNILLMGPSGTGKTQLARSVARMLGVPFYIGDATKLTMAGYVGDDVESLLQGLLASCDGDIEKAQWGIVFLDEADKVARKSGRSASGYRDITGEGVQQSLLKLIEGSKVSVPRGSARAGMTNTVDVVDTENILFILAGSFAGIEDIVRDRVNKSAKLGFGATPKKDLDSTAVYAQVDEADILEFGFIPELLGRIPVRTSTRPLTEDEMVRVLTEPKDAIVKQVTALFSMDQIDLQFDEEALKAIGREAKSRPTGARALRSIVERIVKPYAYECPSDSEVTAIRITQDVVEGKSEAILTRNTGLIAGLG